MQKIIHLALLAALILTPGAAQNRNKVFIASYAGTTALGVQLSENNGNKRLVLESAYVYCASACTITQRIRTALDTGGSATAVTLVALNNVGNPSSSAWRGSSTASGSGTAVIAIDLAAGASMVLDLSLIELASGQGFTILTSSSATIAITYEEQR